MHERRALRSAWPHRPVSHHGPVERGPRTGRKTTRLTGALVPIALASVLAAGCTSTSPGPGSALAAFLAAWGRGDWAAMRSFVYEPPRDFIVTNRNAFAELGVVAARMTSNAARESGDHASAKVTEHLELAGVGAIRIRTTVRLVEHDAVWHVVWSPSTIEPAFRPGSTFVVTTTWPPRATIVGARDTPITTSAPEVEVGIEGNYVQNPTTLTRDLVAAGAPPAAVSAALAGAKTNPTYFEPVFTIARARYLVLKPTLYPLPGTVFRVIALRQAITPGLEAHVVGSVGPVTAAELSSLGVPYTASSTVGQTGLEQIDESRLAGRPGYSVTVNASSGAIVATVARAGATPGAPVQTSIDPAIQVAAEAALAHEAKPAALVAVRASTGQILAAVSDPVSDAFDQALDGEYPPGSTFKTVTATALIDHGLDPESAASCPPTISVDGEVFHNAEGDRAVSDLDGAFAESCNTAFIGLATKDLGAQDLSEAAAFYGIGVTPQMGLPAYGGDAPTPTDASDLAATAIGQGQVSVSPLDMAMIAAAIDSGTVLRPRLVEGSPDDRAPVRHLSSTVVADLHAMMADVVARGTASHEGLPTGTFAKTGTAEYGPLQHLKTDAWLIGFRGDVAFAVLVVNGGFGGPIDGPIAAAFLNAISSNP